MLLGFVDPIYKGNIPTQETTNKSLLSNSLTVDMLWSASHHVEGHYAIQFGNKLIEEACEDP